MNDVRRSLLPLLFGLTSLTTVACAAPVGSSEQVSEDEAPAAAPAHETDIVKLISGTVGTRVDHVELPNADSVMAAPVTELVVQPGPSETVYEVLSYSFGIATDVTSGSPSTGREAGKASLVPLAVTVRPVKPGTAVLMTRLTTGMAIDKLVLRQRQSSGTTDIAEFGMAFVSSMASGIQSGTLDSYGIEVGKVTLKYAKAGVGHDATTGMSVGEAVCGGRAAAHLGPYVQADPSWSIPKDSVRINSASVALSNAGAAGAQTGGAGAGKATLDQMAIDSTMEQTGMCAFFYSSIGAKVPTVRIDSATSVDKNGALVLGQRWEACGALVKEVIFSGGIGQTAPRQTIVFDADGVVRTDFAPGAKAGGSVYGWSFVENTAIASCPAK